MEKFKLFDKNDAGVLVPSDVKVISMAPRVSYHFKCFDENGEFVWEDTIPNLVVDVGSNFVLDTVFRGSGYTASWFLGLVSSVSFTAYAAADTMASHAGWTEFTGYSQANRVAATFGSAAAAKALTASAASVFTINATGTVKGAFLTTNNTKSGTTGTLYSASNFTQGDRPVASGYSVEVTPAISIT